jgi:hypothetical protein
LKLKKSTKAKVFIACLSDGTVTKFGQSNSKQGTFMDHNNEKIKTYYIKGHILDLKTGDYKRAG